MDITVPKERKKAWRENPPQQLSQYDSLIKNDIKFRDYCELSLIFIDASDSVFNTDAKFKRYVDVLVNPSVVYNLSSKKEEPKNDQARTEEQVAERMAKALSYSWKNIVDLIKGKERGGTDSLGIYRSENIDLQFARLESMLEELSRNKYRVSLYTKENAYVR
jgi:hypothetical protein